MKKEYFKTKILSTFRTIKINQKKIIRSCFIAGVCFFHVNEAWACSVCVAAMLDYILPPIGIWCLFSVLWFLVASAIVTFHGTAISGIPKLLPAILIAGICVIGSLFIGPFFLLLLLLPCLISVITIFNKTKKFDHSFVKYFKAVSAFGLLSLAVLIVISVYIHTARSELEFILKWPNTYIGIAKLEDLSNKNPQALKDLRVKLKAGDKQRIATPCNHFSLNGILEQNQALRDFCKPYLKKPIN